MRKDCIFRTDDRFALRTLDVVFYVIDTLTAKNVELEGEINAISGNISTITNKLDDVDGKLATLDGKLAELEKKAAPSVETEGKK